MIKAKTNKLAMGRRHVQNELTICMQICADKSPNVNPLRPWKAVVAALKSNCRRRRLVIADFPVRFAPTWGKKKSH